MKVKNIVFFGFAAAILSGVANADPLQVASTAYVNAQLSGKANSADLAEVATSGAYSDLSGTPDLTVYATTSAMNTALEAKADSADLADYATTQAMNTALQAKANSADLATVATSGSYNDLEDKPQIPAAQVQSDWTATEGMGVIKNKPTLSNVATSGAYSDLSGTPDLTVYATTSAMNTALADKADDSDLTTLEGRVDDIEDAIGTGTMSVNGANQATIVAAINALDSKTNGLATDQNLTDLQNNVTALSTTMGNTSLATTAQTVTGAVNELRSALLAILPAASTCTSSNNHCVLSVDKTTGDLTWIDVTSPFEIE